MGSRSHSHVEKHNSSSMATGGEIYAVRHVRILLALFPFVIRTGWRGQIEAKVAITTLPREEIWF